MSLDIQMDRFIRWIVQWSLIGWNRITEAWDASCEYGVRILRHLEHAHARDEWIFLNSNELPYCAKEGKHSAIHAPTSLFYYPDTHSFILNNRLQSERTQRFDVVQVELGLERKWVDITEFFHSITWKPNGAPSLWEVIVVYCLHQNRPVSKNFMERWELKVFNSDAQELILDLNSPVAKQRFAGWV